MKALILLLLLTACGSARGPQFSEPEKASIILYTDFVRAGGLLPYQGTWNVHINGVSCSLHDRAFVIAKAGKTVITLKPTLDYSSGITLTDNKTHYIRLDETAMNGFTAIGDLFSSKPEVQFVEVPKTQAINELQGMHQDCM